ncbi:tetratricopeptide repeat protein 19, mitochondrial isoform X3 [Columba livia]|uniref:tetratricopeptide repeat protein 19, mitochondrial isoform X3 n=1 Tax=Columba livia TaxID=8932 RepID=UPI0031BB03F7
MAAAAAAAGRGSRGGGGPGRPGVPWASWEERRGGRRGRHHPPAEESQAQRHEGGAGRGRSDSARSPATVAPGGQQGRHRVHLQHGERAPRRLALQGEGGAVVWSFRTVCLFQMANVAFMQGQLDNAEKLYKASMSYLLAGDTKEDDNAILEMSLKLASIYASQKQHELAVAGYQFCILTLEEKIAKQKDLPEDVLPAEEKANTRLLLGMSLDSYARYLLNINQLPAAQQMYEKALQISNDVQGETHPQTVVLMNDLATVLDAQGHYDEAYSYVKRAAELAKETEHSEEHMVLNNLAAILMHKEDFLQAKQVYKEALKQAQQKGDVVSVQHIQEELAELAKRRKGSK